MTFDITELAVPSIKKGDELTAVVFSSDRSGSLIDHPVRAIRVEESLEVGSEVEVRIIETEAEDGCAVGEVDALKFQRAKEEARTSLEDRAEVLLHDVELRCKDERVVGVSGRTVNGFTIFVPRDALAEAPATYVGGDLRVLLTDVGSSSGIASEKAYNAVQEAQAANRPPMVGPEDLSPGDIVEGVVDTVRGAGIGVLLDNGEPAFIPRSLMTTEPVKRGDRIETAIAEIDRQRTRWRIILDRREAVWKRFAFDYRPGRFLTVEAVAHLDTNSGQTAVLCRVAESDPAFGTISGTVSPDEMPDADSIPAVGEEFVVKLLKVRRKAKKAHFSMRLF